jgi:membrane associated rhomboid family serine protease
MICGMERDIAQSPRVSGLKLVGAMAAVMWVSEIVDSILGGDLDRLGIEPRELDGLTGVVLAPFLHGGFGHLIGNTIPFLVLGAVIALSGAARVLAVTAIVTVAGGLATWLVGPDNSVHIGASGVVFGYAAYLLTRGVFSRRLLHLATGVLVLLFYGASLLISLIPTPGVSWQGHLFGGLAGILAAKVLDDRTDRARTGVQPDGGLLNRLAR